MHAYKARSAAARSVQCTHIHAPPPRQAPSSTTLRPTHRHAPARQAPSSAARMTVSPRPQIRCGRTTTVSSPPSELAASTACS